MGGTRGAHDLGFDVAYLKLELNQHVLDALNERLGRRSALFVPLPVVRDLAAHQRAGRLRQDILLKAQLPADYTLLYARRGWMEPMERWLYDERPYLVWSLRHQEVDLVVLLRTGAR